jgi:hypothetical protein
MVESAIVLPLMVFLIVGVIQLVMMQHARIMTEYAAFCAARAGIVWNADRYTMENAAIIALLPTYEGLFDEDDAGNPEAMLRKVMERALLYQVHRRLPQAVDLMDQSAGSIIDALPLPGGAGDALDARADDLIEEAARRANSELEDSISGALGTCRWSRSTSSSRRPATSAGRGRAATPTTSSTSTTRRCATRPACR